MADAALNTPAGAWNTQYENYLNLNLSLIRAQPQDVDAIERQIAEVEEDLLDTPAPHLTAVCWKFNQLLEGQLDGLGVEAEQRRLALEDFENLIQAQRELLGD